MAKRPSRVQSVQEWDRQEDELNSAYHAFTHYRDMPLWDRSQRAAFMEHRQNCLQKPIPKTGRMQVNGNWWVWSTDHAWVARAEAHDAHLAEIRRQQRAAELDLVHEKHAQVASGVISRIVVALNSLTAEDMRGTGIRPLAQALRAASDVQLRALGWEPQSRLALTDADGGPARLVVEYALPLDADRLAETGTPDDLLRITDGPGAVIDVEPVELVDIEED